MSEGRAAVGYVYDERLPAPYRAIAAEECWAERQILLEEFCGSVGYRWEGIVPREESHPGLGSLWACTRVIFCFGRSRMSIDSR